MEFEFDKEMDAILRRARVGEDASSPASHLDADEIAAFADGALPDAARSRFVAHFADCARCRRILSNVITLNSEAAAETASSAVAASVATATTRADDVPWYRRLFAFPNLAYAMGGLVLLFSGFFAYVILQNISGTGSSELSRAVENQAPAERSAPSAANTNASTTTNGSAATSNSSSVSSATVANTTSNSSASNLSALSASNSAATRPAEKTVTGETDSRVADAQPAATPAPKPDVKNEQSDDAPLAKIAPAAPVQQPNAAAGSTAPQDKDRNKKENRFSVDAQENKTADEERAQTERAEPKRKSSDAGAARSVGGKTFNNVGGIWFDAAYTKQKTRNVRRGSSDYQKLDAGLRSIADQLGGTVVIVWGGKAYRIQ